MKLIKLLHTIPFFCLGIGILQAQDSLNLFTNQPISIDTSVRYGKLNNGFTYYLKKNSDEKINLNLIVKAGANSEDDDQLQYAHLLEHLVAQQTRSFKDIDTYFRNAGGFNNARTNATYTYYFAVIPSSDQKIFQDALLILYEWSQGNKWTPEYIATQRAAVQGEMRTSDPYRVWLNRNIEKELFKNKDIRIYDEQKHYKSLQNFNYPTFQRFYNEWYRPDLQALVITGDINVDSLETVIKQKFSDLKNPVNPIKSQPSIVVKNLKDDKNIKFYTIKDSIHPELKLEIIRVQPNFQIQAKTEIDYKNMLLQELYKNILDKRQMILEAQYDPPFAHFDSDYIPGRLENTARMKLLLATNSHHQVKNLFQKGLIAWKQLHIGIQQIDLAEAKTEIIKEYANTQLEASEFLTSRMIQHFIYGKAAPDLKVELNLVTEILNQIDLKDVRGYFDEYGDLAKYTHFIFFKGKNENMPEYKVFKKWITEVDTMQIGSLKNPVDSIASLDQVAKIPHADIMDKLEVSENAIGVSTVVLPNKVKIVLKPTNPNSTNFENTISIEAFRSNPVPFDKNKQYLISQVLPEVLQYSGAGSYTKFEIDKFMRDKGLALRLYSNKNNQLISGESRVENLNELLNLLYLYFDQPRKDFKAFDAWKSSKLKDFEGGKIRGSSEFIMDKIEPVWYPEVPILKVEDVQQFEMEAIFQLAKRWFSDIGGYTFVITGDFDKSEILPLLANTLSGFPVRDHILNKEVLGFPLKVLNEHLTFRNVNQVYTNLFFPVKASRDIKTQIELQILSKALNQRIYNRLRNGCYAPTARGEWIDIKNEVFTFQIEFDSALGNEDVLLTYAMEEFRNLKDHGVDEEWLNFAIKNELLRYERRFGSFGYFNFWPDYLKQKLEHKEDMLPEVLEYGTLLEHFISVEDINSAAKKYMSEKYLQQFFGYPE